MRFHAEPLADIVAAIARAIAADGRAEIEVADPDASAPGTYAGESTATGAIHRPWRAWIELADRLNLRMRTPRPIAGTGTVAIAFEPLAAPRVAFAGYGAGTEFARVHKLEDPGFLLDLDEALARAGAAARTRVLDLGSNRGDVLARIAEIAPRAALTGVDLDASALALAAARLPAATFVTADLQTVALPAAGFDLILAIGTLQSGALDDRAVVRRMLQDWAAPGAAVILGIPNCRYVDGEVSYGARMKNFSQPELGLAIKDIAFYRKYFQQHGRQVFVTGRNYLFVTAVS